MLKSRYNILLPVSTEKLQAECLSCLRQDLPTDGNILLQINMELKVYDGTSREQVLENKRLKFTVAVYYEPRKLYYLAVT